MLHEEVKRIFGEPDKINLSEKDHGVVYYYNDKFIKAKFDENQNLKLFSLEAYNPELTIFDVTINNMTKAQLIAHLNQYGHSKFEHDELTYFETLFFEDIWITFYFEFDKLRGVEFSPIINEGDEIIWPER